MAARFLAARPITRFAQLHASRRPQPFLPRPYQSPINSLRALHDGSHATNSHHDAVEPPEHLSEGERKIFDKIKEELQPLKLEVQDISGGCGSMYALDIVSSQFKGLPVIKQHRLVNKVLGDEMKQWHGVQMKTKAPVEG